MATVLRSFSFVLAGLLVLAIAHKVRVTTSGGAGDEPLVAITRWRRRHAAILLLVAAGVECLVCAALLFRPAIGYAALAVLAVFYVASMRRLSPDDACNCFGSAFRSPSRRSAMVRNGVIAAVSAIGASLYATSAVAVAPASQTTIGVTLVLAAAALSFELLRFVPRAEPSTQSRG